jgi:hypothetical protein
MFLILQVARMRKFSYSGALVVCSPHTMLPAHEEILSIQLVTNNKYARQVRSLFNARFPSSLQTCQLRFQVQILGVNFATKIASTFQCLNYCKQMFIVQVEINNSMESSWSSGLPRRFVFHWIGYHYWVWTFVYKRSSNIEMKFRAQFPNLET